MIRRSLEFDWMAPQSQRKMARKNNPKIRKKKFLALKERAAKQETKAEVRKQFREDVKQQRMEMDGETKEKKPLKRKAQRRLEMEMERLARKGIRLVKADEMEMDDGDRAKKRMRASSDI